MGFTKEELAEVAAMVALILKGDGTAGGVAGTEAEQGDKKSGSAEKGKCGSENNNKKDGNENNGGNGGSKKKQKKTISCDSGGAFTVVPIRRKPPTKTATKKPDGSPTTAASAAPSTNATPAPPDKMIELRAADWPTRVCKNAREARDFGGVAFVPAARYSEAVMVSDKARPFQVVTVYQPKTDLPVSRRTVPVIQGGKTICKTVYVTQVGMRGEGLEEEEVTPSQPPKTTTKFQNGTEVLRVAVWEAHSGATWTAMRESGAKAKEALHKWVCKHVSEIPKEWVFNVQLVGAGTIEGKIRVSRVAVAKALAQSGQDGVFTSSWDRKEPVVWLRNGTYGEALEEAKRKGVVLGLAARSRAIGYRVGTEEERAKLQKVLGEEAVVKDTRARFVVRGLPYGMTHEQLEELLVDMQWPAAIINMRANNALVAAAEEPQARVFDMDGAMIRVDDFSPKPASVTRSKEWSYLAVASGSSQQQAANTATKTTVANDQQSELDTLREENKALKTQLKKLEEQLAAISATLAELKGPGATMDTEKMEEDVAMEGDVCEHQWGKLNYPHAWQCQTCGADKSKSTVQYVCEGCRIAICQDCKKEVNW